MPGRKFHYDPNQTTPHASMFATVLFTVLVFGQLALLLHCVLSLSTESRARGALFRQTMPSRSTPMSRSQRVSLRVPVGLLRPHRFRMGVRLAIGILAVLVCCGNQTLFVEAVAKGELTDKEFKLATWEWVQDTGTATTKWGDIGDWDVSGVGDFSYAFSVHRNQAGGTYVENGNPKAATFVGTDISKWITTSVTSLYRTFKSAGEMNADLSKWSVAKVTSLEQTFNGASKFAGVGLHLWDISKVTKMTSTFTSATSLTSCSKRKIVDAWKSSAAFSSWNTAWAGETCTKVRYCVRIWCDNIDGRGRCGWVRTLLVWMRTFVGGWVVAQFSVYTPVNFAYFVYGVCGGVRCVSLCIVFEKP